MAEKKASGLDNPGFTNIYDIPDSGTNTESSKTGRANKKQVKNNSRLYCTIASVVAIVLLLAIALGVGLYFGFKKDDDDSDRLFFGDFVEMNYTYHQKLSDKVHVKWDFTDTEITFEIEAETDGWIGFGVSKKGGMYPADLIMAWETDNGWEFHDRHATAKSMPSIDDVQNWTLLNAKKESGIITLRFKRDLETCDDEDIPIREGTTRVIFAVGDVKNGQPQQHARDSRWAQSMFLLDPPFYDKYVPEDDREISYFDLLNNNYTIPDNTDTTYYCTIHKVPEYDTKHHMIEIIPIVQEGNEAYVHHILAYYCPPKVTNIDPDEYDGQGYACYGEKPDVFDNCFTVFAGWAVGGRVQYLPKDVGLPLGTDSSPKIIVLETHYDNAKLESGIVDNSGLRLKITSKPKAMDAGVWMVGSSTSYRLIVPPREPAFLHQGYCPQECIAEALQDEEVTVSSVLLHTHLIGAAIKVRVVRNGTEIEPMMADETYDFNFQEQRPIENGYVIKKGDELIVDCVYNTEERAEVTYGGLSTKEEMCLAFLIYHPAKSLSVCYTRMYYDVPNGHDNLREYVQSIDWSQKANHENFQKATKESDLKVTCVGDYGTVKGHNKLLKRTEVTPNEPLPPKPPVCPKN